MKKFLFPVLLLFVFSGYSQSLFNKAYHTAGDFPGPFFIEIQGDYYFTTLNSAGAQRNLYKHDVNGNIKFKKPLTSAATVAAIKTVDNKLMILAQPNWCDVYPGYEVISLNKLDTNGTVLFSVTDTIYANAMPAALLQHSDSSYYFFSDSLCFHHSKTGQLLNRINIGLRFVLGAIELANHNLLLSASYNNVPSLVVISPSGNIVSAISASTSFRKFEFYGGQKIIGLGADENLYSFSANFNQISQSVFPNSVLVSDFSIKNDSLYVLANNGSLTSYLVSDTSFNTVHFASNNMVGHLKSLICPAPNNKIALYTYGAAKNASPGYQDYYVAFSMIDKFSGTTYSNDLALLSVTADSIYYIGHSGSPSGPINYATVYMRPKVKLRNVGTAIVKNFNLNAYESMSIDGCTKYYYQERFSNLNVLPGDSLELIATHFAVFNYVNVYMNAVTGQFCFYSTIPNDDVDKVLQDNETCINVSIAVTGLDEMSENLDALKVFPNPSQNNFTIQSISIINSVEVYNVIGELINNQTSVGRVFNTGNDLSPGVYFLKINTNKGTTTKKVLKN